MKIAIHHRKEGFSRHWIEYCEKHSIPYKIVDCYSTTIIEDVSDCDIVMWHFHHANYKDMLFAKQLMYSLQSAGKKVFPDFHTCWHFDDKIGQAYLLESIEAPIVPSYLFYDKGKALKWAASAEFPKVFKLRRGAGSSQVRLIRKRRTARKIINKAFGKGFSQYVASSNLKERWRLYRIGKNSLWNVFKGVLRLGYTTEFDRITGNERGYVYFQDFIPYNDSDIRVIVINRKAFAIKRIVRKNDFRASGSGEIEYGKELFDENTIRLSFELADKLNTPCLALDYVYSNGKPMIVEISFGYTPEGYVNCKGYWDYAMNWHEIQFNPQYWMVELLLEKVSV